MPWLLLAVAALCAIILGRGVATRLHASRPPLIVQDDDPLVLAARDRARATRGEFLARTAEHAERSYVKLPVPGEDASRWCRVLELDGDALVARPVDEDEDVGTPIRAGLDELRDWQVELEDGRIAGGFSVLAFFRRAEEAWGRLPADVARQRRRYLEADRTF